MRASSRLAALLVLTVSQVGTFAFHEGSITVETPVVRLTEYFTPAALQRVDARSDHSGVPPGTSSDALRGTILLHGSQAACLIDRDLDGHYFVVVDYNLNEDLTDDAAVRFLQTAVGDSALLEANITHDGEPLKLVLPLGNDGKPTLTLRQYVFTERTGSFRSAERDVKFVLKGTAGVYNNEKQSIYFDLDGDGRLDTENRHSDERVIVGTGHVTIDGRSYGFEVDPAGRSVRIIPLAKALPLPPSLEAGSTAPAFTFQDLGGNTGSLQDYRGRPLLLYFWGTWCGPCREEMPEVIATHAANRDRFDVLALNKGDSRPVIQAFIVENPTGWRFVEESQVALDLYRVVSFPMWFLIDQNGTIVAHREPGRSSNLPAALQTLTNDVDKAPGLDDDSGRVQEPSR